MQLFSLIYIVAKSELLSVPKMIQELSLVGASLSAIVFAIGFYQGRFFPTIENYKGLIVNTILLNIVILTAFYHYMLFEYLPYTIIYAILFVSIIFNFKDGFKPTLVYVCGWSIFCFLLFIFDFKTYYSDTNLLDIVLVAFAIEAVLFTISVAFKYSSLQQQSQSYENMLLQQSKLAKSGEMIGNITHQFRQPLNNIAYILMNMKKRYEQKSLDENYFDKKINQANHQLQFMSKTIDDFKSFYAPSKEKTVFEIKECIEESLTIVDANLKKRNIDLQLAFQTNEDIQIFGIKNELSQVIVALLSNAIEALVNITDPWIKVQVSSTNAEVIIYVEDNAKGIVPKELEKIFEPYFSTKKEGTGIGLYLSKLIIEQSFEGNISVENSRQGARFSLTFEKLSLS